MSIDLSLADVFEEAFGYRSPALAPKFSHLPERKTEGAKGSAYYSPAKLGQEYYLPVRLYYVDTGSADVAPGTGSAAGQAEKKRIDVYLPHPVISVTCRKTIIETPLTERRGTVKEVINIQDYEITVKGLIIGANNEYPESEVTELKNIFELNKAVNIANPITDIFLMGPETSGSDKVVIRELSFPEVRGSKNVRPYQLVMVSDAPFNLIDLK